jgi:hypothetical protein
MNPPASNPTDLAFRLREFTTAYWIVYAGTTKTAFVTGESFS